MTQNYAAAIAMLSMLSALVPIILGIISIKYFNNFYKYVLASIIISVVFDAISISSSLTNWIPGSVLNYYDFFAIFSWGLAFGFVLKKHKLERSIPQILIGLVLMLSLYLALTNSGVISVNHPNATLGSLFILAGSTLLVMYFLIVKPEIEKSDIPIIAILSANIIYYATVTSIFIFFSSVSEDQIINLYLIKWILYIGLNLFFAFIFYNVRTEKWA